MSLLDESERQPDNESVISKKTKTNELALPSVTMPVVGNLQNLLDYEKSRM